MPDKLHFPSTRPFLVEPPDPTYPSDWETRRVNRNGSVSWNRGPLSIGQVLAGELVGVKPIDYDRVEFYFGPVLLGYYDPGRVQHRLIRPRRKRRKGSPRKP